MSSNRSICYRVRTTKTPLRMCHVIVCLIYLDCLRILYLLSTLTYRFISLIIIYFHLCFTEDGHTADWNRYEEICYLSLMTSSITYLVVSFILIVCPNRRKITSLWPSDVIYDWLKMASELILFSTCAELLPEEVPQILKRNSQYFMSYLRKT